jgi:predicted nucleotidyltransferase
MNIFEQIFRELNKAKVKYLVVGGVAVNLYGYVRFTGDLDLLVLLDESNLVKIDKVLRRLGYKERLPVSIKELGDHKKVKTWLKERNLKAFSFTPPKNNPLQIDLIIEESLKFDKFNEKRNCKKISGVTIPVVSIEDLIKMKKRANRDKDLLDLEALIKLKGL